MEPDCDNAASTFETLVDDLQDYLEKAEKLMGELLFPFFDDDPGIFGQGLLSKDEFAYCDDLADRIIKVESWLPELQKRATEKKSKLSSQASESLESPIERRADECRDIQ